jgi:hypothetical protein
MKLESAVGFYSYVEMILMLKMLKLSGGGIGADTVFALSQLSPVTTSNIQAILTARLFHQ